MIDTQPHTRQSHLLPSLAVAVSGAAWGLFWIPLRWLDGEGLGSAWVSLIFFTVAGLVPLPWLLTKGRHAHLTGPALVTGLLLGSAFTLYTVSLTMTGVVRSILLFYMTPLWSSAIGYVVHGERLTPRRVAAMAAAVAGLYCVLGAGAGLPLPRNGGDWLALVSGFLWAAGTVRSYSGPRAPMAVHVFAYCAAGALASLLAALIAMQASLPEARADNVAGMLPWAILLAFVFFAPPNFLVLWAARNIDSGRVGILLMTEVLAGAASAAVLSGEPFGHWEAAGMLLILLAGSIEVLARR